MIKQMKRLSWDQRKSLAEFVNMIAAAWFTAGVITPFFTKPKRIEEYAGFFIGGLMMTAFTLGYSIRLLERKRL